MEIYTKAFQTSKGVVEGIQAKWPGFHVLLVAGKKGFLACGAFDLEAIESFGAAAAIVESTPQNPIGTLERFPDRKVTKVNSKASSLGLSVGMDVSEAFEKIA
jgi:uncharacterized protein YunC (DUF1805 family)